MVAKKKIIVDDQNSVLLEAPKEKEEKCVTNFTQFDKSLDFFHVMKHDEPHNLRRIAILAKHPEIKQLFVKEPMTFVWVIYIHLFQLFSCYVISCYDFSWPVIVVAAFFIGAIPNHALYVLIHDITHFTVLNSLRANQMLAIFANLPQIIPSAVSFGRYHRDHHSNFGDILNDPDIPTVGEVKFFNTWYKRLFYVMFMPIFYALRPYFKKPKSPSGMELFNIFCSFLYGSAIAYFFSAKALAYLTLGTLFGLSINPIGGHLIGEHYEFFKGQDSYSYYGWMNIINFNVGLHVEHHDFPNIPWSKLPQVRKIAPEFYDNLPQLHSYFDALFKYVFDSTMGPWSRISINLSKVWNEEAGDYRNDDDYKPNISGKPKEY